MPSTAGPTDDDAATGDAAGVGAMDEFAGAGWIAAKSKIKYKKNV